MYNTKDGKFYAKDKKTNQWTVPAPKKVNEQVNNEKFKQAIDKGLRHLEE